MLNIAQVGDLDTLRNASNLKEGSNIKLRQPKTEVKVNPKIYELFEEDMISLLMEVKVSGILNKDKVYLTEDDVKDSLRKFLYLYIRPNSGEGEEEYKLRYDTIFLAYFNKFKESDNVYKSIHESKGLVFDVRV